MNIQRDNISLFSKDNNNVTSDIPLSTSLWGFEMALCAVFIQRYLTLKVYLFIVETRICVVIINILICFSSPE